MNPNNPMNSRNPTKPFVSIVVPAYNEASIIEKNLTGLCECMASLESEYRWELIVVNDGRPTKPGIWLRPLTSLPTPLLLAALL